MRFFKHRSIGVNIKPSASLSADFNDHVYFDHRDQFDPSMGSSDTGSDNSGRTS